MYPAHEPNLFFTFSSPDETLKNLGFSQTTFRRFPQHPWSGLLTSFNFFFSASTSSRMKCIAIDLCHVGESGGHAVTPKSSILIPYYLKKKSKNTLNIKACFNPRQISVQIQHISHCYSILLYNFQ